MPRPSPSLWFLILGIFPAIQVTAAVEPETLAMHRGLLALDTHFDTAAHLRRAGWDVTRRHDWTGDLSQVDLPRMIEGGIDGGFWTLFTAQGPRTPEGHAGARDEALQIALRIHSMVARHGDAFEMALAADDAARIAAAGRSVVYLSMENGYPIGSDLTLVRTFYDLGVRMLGPVHFANNDLGDSATDPKGPEWGGLSPLGKQLVAECNRLGIVLDASHAHDSVLEQMLDLSAVPVILSHSGCKAVFDHPRNISDDLLRRVAAKGGVIQMNAFSTYVAAVPKNEERDLAMRDLMGRFGGRAGLRNADRYSQFMEARRRIEERFPMPLATFDQYIAHVLHALEVVGPGHVGISGDFDGGGGVEGFMDVTGAPRITQALVEAGYTAEDCAKVWGGNVLRLLRSAEAHAHAMAAGPTDMQATE